jgi:hypothetical protein
MRPRTNRGYRAGRKLPPRASRPLVVLLFLLAAISFAAVEATAAPQPGLSEVAFLREGRFEAYRWGVAVENDRGHKGVCMIVAVLRRSGTGPGENAACSAPALTRGNTRSLSLHKAGGGIALTVFGGAFDHQIRRVQAVMLDGSVKNLPFLRPRPVHEGKPLSRFHYVALSVKGPWCIAELVTRNGEGAVMYRARGDEIVSYSPEKQCLGVGL